MIIHIKKYFFALGKYYLSLHSFLKNKGKFILEDQNISQTAGTTPESVESVQTTAAVAEAPVAETRAPRHYYTEASNTAHDDFDWSVDKRNVASYKEEDRKKFDQVYDGTFKAISENELMMGTVEGLTKTDAIINIGFKSDGLISLNEFRDMPNVKIGDVVEVMVVEKKTVAVTCT